MEMTPILTLFPSSCQPVKSSSLILSPEFGNRRVDCRQSKKWLKQQEVSDVSSMVILVQSYFVTTSRILDFEFNALSFPLVEEVGLTCLYNMLS